MYHSRGLLSFVDKGNLINYSLKLDLQTNHIHLTDKMNTPPQLIDDEIDMDRLDLKEDIFPSPRQMTPNTGATRLMPNDCVAINFSPMVISPISRNSALNSEDKQHCIKKFESWNEHEQIEFVKELISRMAFHQQEKVNSFLEPILQRDFISELANRGLDNIACYILSSLDERSLCRAELVCRTWYDVIMKAKLWRKLIMHNIRTQPLWRGLAERRKWGQFLIGRSSGEIAPIGGNLQLSGRYYRLLYPCIIQDIKVLEKNWQTGIPRMNIIQCNSSNSKGVYCLQYDDRKIVSGLRDNTIKIWERDTLNCVQILKGHTGSVLCLQYDENVIISGSSDSTIRVWDVHTGAMIKTLIHHCEAVLHLRFDGVNMVTCSKDRTIAVWVVNSSSDIVLRRVLVGHRAAVNVVDFDDKFIVSASGDRTIKVWRTSTCEFIRTLQGHRRGIACLQYRDNLVVSGSSDNSIRLWDIHTGQCLRILEGHEELVRCIRFDDKRIVSGAYDGKIKVWDLEAAMNPRVPTATLCIRTLDEHTGRVFRLQFDSFQIISSSHDDTILIWDFLDQRSPDHELTRQEEQEMSNSNQMSSFDYYQEFLYSENT